MRQTFNLKLYTELFNAMDLRSVCITVHQHWQDQATQWFILFIGINLVHIVCNFIDIRRGENTLH